jgi:hypothetical protein
MKKVCYAIGAAGLAPLAAGLIAPSTATASSNAVHAPKAGTKTVSLNPVRAVVPAAGCTGFYSTGWLYSTGGNIDMRFWYTPASNNNTCIGTVEGNNYHPMPQEIWRVRVWHGTTLEYQSFSGNFHPAKGIHGLFPNGVQVCTAWIKSGTSTIVQGPVCDTVG